MVVIEGPQVAHVSVENSSEGFVALLDDIEQQRAASFLRASDRDRFILGAIMAKAMIARATGVAFDDIRLDRTCRHCGLPHGRPALLAPDVDLDFSVTHSGEVVAVALSVTGRVGIDVEHVNRRQPSEDAMSLVLADQEQLAFSQVVAKNRPHAFLRVWTRKEALVKLMGIGVAVNLKEVIVSGPEDPAQLVDWPEIQALPGTVRLFDLGSIPQGHVMSLAVLDSGTTAVQVVSGIELLADLA